MSSVDNFFPKRGIPNAFGPFYLDYGCTDRVWFHYAFNRLGERLYLDEWIGRELKVPDFTDIEIARMHEIAGTPARQRGFFAPELSAEQSERFKADGRLNFELAAPLRRQRVATVLGEAISSGRLTVFYRRGGCMIAALPAKYLTSKDANALIMTGTVAVCDTGLARADPACVRYEYRLRVLHHFEAVVPEKPSPDYEHVMAFFAKEEFEAFLQGQKALKNKVVATRSNSKGGRPPSYDWQAFENELDRLKAAGNLPPTSKLVPAMQSWFCERMELETPPDERTIRRHLDEYQNCRRT